MKKTIVNLFVILGLTTSAFAAAPSTPQPTPQDTDFSQRSKPATLKVLLQRQVPEFLLEVKGRHHIYNPFNGQEISNNLLSRRHRVTSLENANKLGEKSGIKWGESYDGFHQFRIVPHDTTSSILVNGIQYKGVVEIHLIDGKFDVINEVDVESYLKTVLSSTFPKPMQEEVLNAITIVARTKAYFIGYRNKTSFWHIDAQEVGYQGLAMLPKLHIERAVEVTNHAIMTFNKLPFPATWTENSAGKTVDYAAIFRKAFTTPSGVEAPLAAKDRQQSKWTCSLSKELLAKATDLHHVTGVDLYITPKAEKVYAVKVTGDSQVKDFDFVTFQKIVGAKKLRSNDFTVQTKGDELVFTGYG